MNGLQLKDSPNGKPNNDPFWGMVPFLSGDSDFHPEPIFDRMIYLERKRTERSRRPFMLLLFNMEGVLKGPDDDYLVKTTENALSSCLRETDIKGWYEQGKVIGIILTEMGSIDEIVKEKVFLKIQNRLVEEIGAEAVDQIKVSYHVFPESYNGNGKDREWFNSRFYPEVTKKSLPQRFPFFIKRGLDILGSIAGLLALSPVFLIVALGVKLSSKGPVLFRQERVGQWGKTFTFLKFRSMYVNSDEAAHKEYVSKFIVQGNGTAPAGGQAKGETVYKLTNDRRITPLGGILRKTSLDEIPQFINVLKGEMSLVGPRPPIPYECEIYDIWHRRRLLAVKPGITGLWQVEGRSQRTFDEMVRLDLKYIGEWSLWLDLKILLKTPWVMMSGAGGY
jgi:lipopolysaccharide/colanic/teichoic acid biosynthesis glycosyltransferase